MRRATLAYALVLGCCLGTTSAHGQDLGAAPTRADGPDPTGSLPAEVYASIPALVRGLRSDTGAAAAAELRALCSTHGAEATLNALYFGRRLGAAPQVESALGDLIPAEASLLPRFDAAGRPDPTGLAFVHVRRDLQRDVPYFSEVGWLARCDEDGAEVLTEGLEIVRCSPGDVTHPRVADPFRDYCRAFFSTKLVDPEAESAWDEWRRALNTGALRSWVLADWSFRRGDIGHAIRLWEHARAVCAHRFFRGPRDGETFEDFISEELASALEQQAVLAADEGEPRGELRERWRTVARVRAGQKAVQHDPPTIPPTDLGGATSFTCFGWHEAGDMVRLYDRLLAEDEAWHEPTPEERAGLDAAALARYWMFKIRESRAGRHAMGSHEPSMVSWGPEHDPARRLFALGWSAIPELIEHYEDPRPTRGHRRYFLRGTGGAGYTPWRYADCSVELLNLITGEVFRNRAAAAEWWRTARRTDLPVLYLELLRSEDREAREKAALWLLALDDRTYADAVITRALEGDPFRSAMLAFLKGHVREPGATRLMPLVERGDRWTMLATACVLQDTGRARDAARTVLDRLAKEPSDEDAKVGFAHLAAMQDDDLRASFARALSKEKGRSRDLLLDSAHLFPGPEVLAALVALLGEDGRAVIAVKRMLIYAKAGSAAGAGEEVEWREAEVREWLAKHDPDWADLRQRVSAQSRWYGAQSFYPFWFRW